MNWQRPYVLALGITGVMVAVGGFATLFTVFVQGKITDPQDILRIATAELAAGRYSIAEGLAERIEVDPDAAPELHASREYIIGVSRTQLALREPDRRHRRLAIRAALPTLEEAAMNGALNDLRGRFGNRVWGEAAFELGDFDAADERLTKGLNMDPTAARQLLPMIARSRILSPKAPAAKAVEACESLMRLPTLTPEERVAAQLMMAEARMKAAQWQEAERNIEAARKLQINSDAVTLMDAELKLEQGDAIRKRAASGGMPTVVSQMLEDILESVNEVARTGDPGAVTHANYIAARALRMLGRDDSAIEVFANVRLAREPMFMPAAGIQELELLAKNKHEAELLTSTKLVIQDIGDPQIYDGSILRIEACRERLLAIAEQLVNQGLYRTAVDYSRMLSPLVPPFETLAIEGRAWASWANQLEQEVNKSTSLPTPEMLARIRKYHRDAGRAWHESAQLQFTEKNYPDLLWLAIESLQRGNAFENSLELIDDYLRYVPRDGQPRGLVAKGNALLSVGKVPLSLRSLGECIEQYPEDPQRFSARLIAAKCYGELGQFSPARTMLEANLYDGALVPQSPIWRDSLLTLGQLLYRQALETHLALTRAGPSPVVVGTDQRSAIYQLLTEAIDRLETGDERERERERARKSERKSERDREDFSNEYRRALPTRYHAGMAHRMAAHWRLHEANLPDTIDSVRRDLLNQQEGHLEASLLHLASLREELGQMQEKNIQLSAEEELLLRSSYLEEGETLFELGRYDDACKTYAGASLRYSGEPIGLEATVRQARCYTAMNRPVDAARAYRQAEKNLDRIPDSQDPMFLRTTRHDRAGWKNMLSWMNDS